MVGKRVWRVALSVNRICLLFVRGNVDECEGEGRGGGDLHVKSVRDVSEYQ